MTARNTTPSNAVSKGALVGTPGAVLVAWALSLLGVEVPPGVEGAIGALLTGLLTWKFKGGRKGEAA